MAYNFSPKIVTNGLVLYLDAANSKSYNTVNLARNSEALNLWANNGVSGGGISVTANVEIAPDSTLTADTLAQNPSVSGASRWISSTTRTYTAGVTYTLSIWLKKVSGVNTQPTISLWVNGGTLTSVGTITNNWVRYSATFTPVNTISVNTFSGLSVGWGVNGQANDFVFAAWGFQIEIGPVATTYIPSTNTWTDLSRGGNNGTLTNGPTFNSSNNGSIVFDGTDDYVNIGTTNLAITRDFTISFWANITKNGSVEVFNKGYIPPDYGIYLAKLVSNKLTLQSYNIGTVDTNATIVPGITNYTVSRNNTNCSWYINGVLDKSQVVTSANINQSNLKEWRIGSNFDTIRPTFGGNIYSFIVYNVGLTQQQVLQNYNTTKSRFGIL